MSTAFALAVCGRCGEPVTGSDDACAVCNGTVARAVLPLVHVDAFAAGAPAATAGRRSISLAISLLAVAVAGAVVAGLALPLGVGAALAFGVAAALLAAAAQAVGWLRCGRALGNILTSTRSVRAADGTPVGLRLPERRDPHAVRDPRQGPIGRMTQTVTLRVSASADPGALSMRGVGSLPPRVPAAVLRERLTRSVVLTFDGRLRVPVTRSVILGRNPSPAADGTAVVALPDMSRSISKSHVRLDVENGRVFARDLGSTNGTELVTASGIRELTPDERVEVPAGAQLRIAGVPLRIDDGSTGRTA